MLNFAGAGGDGSQKIDHCMTLPCVPRSVSQVSARPERGGLPQSRHPLRDAGDARQEVAVGDEHALGDPRGAAGVHDDGQVRRPRPRFPASSWGNTKGGNQSTRSRRWTAMVVNKSTLCLRDTEQQR